MTVAGPGPLAGLDPGRSKCGLVLTDPERREIREALVLPPEAAWERLEQWHRHQALAAVVIGDGTGSGPWRRRLEPLLPGELVDDPQGLRLPPRDVDDVVAQLLLERRLGRELLRTTPAP